MSTTEQYWKEIRSLDLKLCYLTLQESQHRSETARVRRQQKKIIDTAISKCASDRTFWLRIKAFHYTRHSLRIKLLAQSFAMAKQQHNLPEQFHAASALAEEYSEKPGKQALVSKWLRYAKIASASQPKRVISDLLDKLKPNNDKKAGEPSQPNARFVSPEIAPVVLKKLDGNCGPITAWVVLKYFGITASASRLIKSCGYVPGYGVSAIGLAVAFRERGLEVIFHTEPDPNPTPAEKELVKKALNLGIPVRNAVSLRVLLRYALHGDVPIVLYDTRCGDAHFSPLVGMCGNSLLLLHERGGLISKREFLKRWRATGILRQSIVVLNPRKTDNVFV